MKLIEDINLLDNQINWFEKQRKLLDIKNFNVSGISEKDNKINSILNGSSIQIIHLEELRNLLSSEGLKKLSNSLASVKKRNKSNKKSLQLMLNNETIEILKKVANKENQSISEYLETLALKLETAN